MTFSEPAGYGHINHPNNPYSDPDATGLCAWCESAPAGPYGTRCADCARDHDQRTEGDSRG